MNKLQRIDLKGNNIKIIGNEKFFGNSLQEMDLSNMRIEKIMKEGLVK